MSSLVRWIFSQLVPVVDVGIVRIEIHFRYSSNLISLPCQLNWVIFDNLDVTPNLCENNNLIQWKYKSLAFAVWWTYKTDHNTMTHTSEN